MLNVTSTSDAINSGSREIAALVGGSIQPNSLAIIEGESKSGKSVMCQHLTFSTLLATTNSVAYYTMYGNFTDLITQMEMLSLPVQHFYTTDRLRISSLHSLVVRGNLAKTTENLIDSVRGLPARFNVVVIDAATPFMVRMNPAAKMDLFQSFKEQCASGRSVILVVSTHVLEKSTATRIFDMSDYYLHITMDEAAFKTEGIDNRAVRILKIRKLRGAEVRSGDTIKFEIKPKTGIQILPFVKVRV
ncbi:MAG: ATPase domain-containing protein [Dehalococcoidales bacterium]|nr:ATPase domain-containing protein [Dehalococcoidales bacterium]